MHAPIVHISHVCRKVAFNLKVLKTLKTFKKPNQTSSIPPLNVNGNINSDNTDKANILNDYFTEQPSLDDSNANVPADLNIPDFTLNSISITANEVESVLKALKTGKTSGPDAINKDIILKELLRDKSQLYGSKPM